MKKVEEYIPLVKFLGQALGQHYEIVLHDLAMPEQSIIAIENGHISNRCIGGPVTDFVLKLLKREQQEHVPCITNYRGKVGEEKLCRSSSFFIKDENGKIIGMLCINMDLTPYIRAREFLDEEMAVDSPLEKHLLPGQGNSAMTVMAGQIFENFHGTSADVISTMIHERLRQYPVRGNRLSLSERLQIVSDLNNDGLFLLRGGIAALAARLDVSEPTVYRYLSKIRTMKIKKS
jgi:predicted transcriptional regulator YheO